MSVGRTLVGVFRLTAAVLVPLALIAAFGHFLQSPDLYPGDWGRFGLDRSFYVLAAAGFGCFAGAVAAHSAHPFPVTVPAIIVAGGLFLLVAPDTVSRWIAGDPGGLVGWATGIVVPASHLLGALWMQRRLQKRDAARTQAAGSEPEAEG